MSKHSKYYNWQKTFSYNATLNMVITARGRGKTYGIRKQCVSDYLKNGKRFAEIVRYNKNISETADGYFTKLEHNNEFPDHIFKVIGDKGYIAKKPLEIPILDKETGEELYDDEGNLITKSEKPKWELLCYFVSLNGQQNAKKKTFVNIGRIIFDEFILEKNSFPGYLPREYKKFVNLIDTLAREVLGETEPVKIYMLSNACDIVNPYFQEYGIYDEPEAGYRWLVKGDVLLHFENDPVYSEEKLQTVAGRLSRGHNSDMVNNVFSNAGDQYIAKKPKDAKFAYGFVYRGEEFGVWISWREGYYYINDKIPNGTNIDVFSLSTSDNAPNYLMARRNEPRLRKLIDLFYNGLVRYSTPSIREQFFKVTSLFGVR